MSVRKDHAERGVQCVGVAPGSDQALVGSAAERWRLDWPMARDRGSEIARQFEVKAYPVLFLIGYDGIIEAVHGRASNLASENGLDNLEIELRTEINLLQ